MKEFKIIFAEIDDSLDKDSFTVYVDGVKQENVKSVELVAHNAGGDVLRGLADKVVWDGIGSYRLERYIQ